MVDKITKRSSKRESTNLHQLKIRTTANYYLIRMIKPLWQRGLYHSLLRSRLSKLEIKLTKKMTSFALLV